MATITASDALDNLAAIKLDPAASARYVLGLIETASDGDFELVDPSNTFSWLLNASAILSTNSILEGNVLARKLYPKLATVYTDLYRHMADIDYKDRFCNPAKATIRLYLNLDEVYQRAVLVPGTNTYLMTIPRNTTFYVDGYAFSMQYPLDIKVLANDNLRIGYDTSEPSPITLLESNVDIWSVVRMQDRSSRYLILDLETEQFDVDSKTMDTTISTGLINTFAFKDQYYYCRVWGKDGSGNWVEYATTHSDQVYDPTKVTAVLTVTDGQLQVQFPQIYYNSGLLAKQTRIDIMTSKGAVDINLGDYPTTQYQVKFRDFSNKAADAAYRKVIDNFSDYSVTSSDIVEGGSNGLTFDQLRDRVIMNATQTVQPISDAQLRSVLENDGYNMLLSKDIITTRTYLATRSLPLLDQTSGTAGASCSIETLTAKMTDLVALKTVRDNGQRITVEPETLFEVVNGALDYVSDVEVDTLNGYDAETLTSTINGRQFVITPFHYVLDATGSLFQLRPYLMSTPEVVSRNFIKDNESTQLQVGISTIQVTRTDTGYTILVAVGSGSAYKALRDDQVFAQMAFLPDGETSYGYINGTLAGIVDGERVWQFDIESNFDVDSNDLLVVENFALYSSDPQSLKMALQPTFQIYFAVNDYDDTVVGLEVSDVDAELGTHLLPSDVWGISNDQLVVELGKALPELWSNSRATATTLQYQRYENDVLAYYPDDVYETDDDGDIILADPDGDGNFDAVLLHSKGDPIYLEDGVTQKVLHEAGSLVRDSEGNLLPIVGREIQYYLDMLMVNGIYRFVTDATDIAYRDTITDYLVNYITDDVRGFRKLLLENTNMFFSPKRTQGQIQIIVDNDLRKTINSALSWTVDVYLSATNYSNSELRTNLNALIRKTIHTALTGETVSVQKIGAAIEASAGDDVIAITVYPVGPSDDISVFSAADGASRCSVKRILDILPEGTIAVDDDITINYIKHTSPVS